MTTSGVSRSDGKGRGGGGGGRKDCGNVEVWRMFWSRCVRNPLREEYFHMFSARARACVCVCVRACARARVCVCG